MAGKSDYLENKFIDWLFRGQSYTPPATLYIGLYTTVPSADAGTGGVEVSGGSYARASVAASLANWAGTQAAGSTVASSGTGGQTSNNNVITFAAPTANWGTIAGFGIFDAASGGNMLYFGSLTASKTVNNGDAAPAFAAGALTVTED